MKIAAHCHLDMLQLHGEESPEFCHAVSLPVIKAFRIAGNVPVETIQRYTVEWVLLDAYSTEQYGGTGKAFEWSLLSQTSCPKPFLLAGGLDENNVAAAIRRTRPNGVDVSGGVETNGTKDIPKIIRFINAARLAEKEQFYS